MRAKTPWGLLAFIAFIGACTVASRTGRTPKKISFSTFCPSTSPPLCPDADREEYDPVEGRYYCFFDCAVVGVEVGAWKVTFVRVWQDQFQEYCWVHAGTTKIGECP